MNKKEEAREMERLNEVSNANRPEGYHNAESKHTPTPKLPLKFHQFDGGDLEADILDADGNRLVDGLKPDLAIFIVKAANCHEELLEACKFVSEIVGKIPAFDDGSFVNKRMLGIVLNKANKAIAKAEGK
jgi:hypothetical protein